jgi:hypothetical protein
MAHDSVMRQKTVNRLRRTDLRRTTLGAPRFQFRQRSCVLVRRQP